MDLLNHWFKANQLSLNMSKTVFMTFWEKGPNITVTVEGVNIPNVRVTKFLGVFMDHTLSWDSHVSNLLDKLMINQHLLSVSSNLLNKESLRLIYHAYIQSHLVYGLSIRGSMASKKNLTKIFQAQKACTKITGKLPKSAHLDSTFKKQKLLTIYELIDLELCKFGYFLAHQTMPMPIQKMLNKSGRKRPTDIKHITRHYLMCRSIQPVFNQSFLCKGPIMYNHLLYEMKHARTKQSFTRKLKKYILEKS